jgi:DNA-binding NtrC family response regulator
MTSEYLNETANAFCAADFTLTKTERQYGSDGPVAQQTPLVLVVEDEPDSRALLERWLTLDGFEVKSFGDAESAIEALSRTLPTAICLDLGLPGMAGLDALGHIRKHNPTLPVVILTADRDAEIAMQAIR